MKKSGTGLALVGVLPRTKDTEFRVFARFRKIGTADAVKLSIYRSSYLPGPKRQSHGVSIPLAVLPDLIEILQTAYRLTTHNLNQQSTE